MASLSRRETGAIEDGADVGGDTGAPIEACGEGFGFESIGDSVGYRNVGKGGLGGCRSVPEP